MRVTSWTEYSLIISIHLARRRGPGSRPVPARELADQERLPADYVEQILLRLRRAGLIESVRGVRGGYRLARDPTTITVRDIMAAAERQTFTVNCETRPIDAERCAPTSPCTIRPVWRVLQRRVDDLLASIRLSDLLQSEDEVRELVAIGTNP